MAPRTSSLAAAGGQTGSDGLQRLPPGAASSPDLSGRVLDGSTHKAGFTGSSSEHAHRKKPFPRRAFVRNHSGRQRRPLSAANAWPRGHGRGSIGLPKSFRGKVGRDTPRALCKAWHIPRETGGQVPAACGTRPRPGELGEQREALPFPPRAEPEALHTAEPSNAGWQWRACHGGHTSQEPAY